MKLDWQTAVAIGLVGMAFLYLVRSALAYARRLRAGRGQSACGGGCGCSTPGKTGRTSEQGEKLIEVEKL